MSGDEQNSPQWLLKNIVWWGLQLSWFTAKLCLYGCKRLSFPHCWIASSQYKRQRVLVLFWISLWSIFPVAKQMVWSPLSCQTHKKKLSSASQIVKNSMFYENSVKHWPSVSHFHLCRALSQFSCCMPSSYSSPIHSARLVSSLVLLLFGGGRRQSPSWLYTRSAGYQKQGSLGSDREFISMSQMSKWELLVIITHTNRHWMPFPRRTDRNEIKSEGALHCNTLWKSSSVE